MRQAGGTLVYATRSAPKTLPKPPLGHCENVAGDGLLLNNTDATALLYGFKNCPGTAAHAVAPGAHLDATFQSVKFVE
ncbi:hypothetical protein [Streptomyces sp. NPDC088258]|uniref:hypothetical protein n=1 Tax=Streptomyces sp. NPDC088258 TaxID=3365849 RepID=UPI003828C52E